MPVSYLHWSKLWTTKEMESVYIRRSYASWKHFTFFGKNMQTKLFNSSANFVLQNGAGRGANFIDNVLWWLRSNIVNIGASPKIRCYCIKKYPLRFCLDFLPFFSFPLVNTCFDLCVSFPLILYHFSTVNTQQSTPSSPLCPNLRFTPLIAHESKSLLFAPLFYSSSASLPPTCTRHSFAAISLFFSHFLLHHLFPWGPGG